MYFNEINILDYYSVEWKSACVGVYQLLNLKNARWNIEIRESNDSVKIYV